MAFPVIPIYWDWAFPAIPIYWDWAFPMNGRPDGLAFGSLLTQGPLVEGDYSRRLFEGDYSKEWRTRYFVEWYLNLVPELGT